MKANELSFKLAYFYQVDKIQNKVTSKVKHSGLFGSTILEVS